MVSVLGKKVSKQHLQIFFSKFCQRTVVDISCKLSLRETVCMKCQTQFSEKNKKNINFLCVEFPKSMLSVRQNSIL